MTSEPDGIAFHASTPKFVVTDNTDGTMTRFDFPADDYTQVPVQSVFASGGFRGDLSQVGADGCLYLTQAGTRYDNGVVTGENSLVQICGGFAPPRPARALLVSPN
jgi:sugar lactone lactonase YvrE